MKTLANKVALVTGSARGLGRAIAERYAALGASVVLNYYRDQAAADEVLRTVQALGVPAIAVQADMSRVADIERLFAEAQRAYGRLDIVVANAGVELVDLPATDFTEAQFDHLFSLNAKGTYFTLQQGARAVADNGRLLYVASSTTAFPAPGMAVYGGSKTPGRYLIDVLAKELGPRGITANSIIPYATAGAGIFTEGHSSVEYLIVANPMGRLATVADVANVAEFFASDLASFVSGQHLLVNGGANL
ncbi:SDR family oxidoreductase [Hymenobacter setariae]|uniref:SDR family oxidoreductase n=1 Tax=Hymenobacter setariae TaxID=2594794 RepID=A0A558BS30_9BACT|nr:SDR family oxidoreductase [Hymenobacter setariae]TVT39326.1 SDR family oxidoreductase [Hymenobacter setariae]